MTIAQLEEWLITNNQQDQWWLQIDGSNLGQRVALEKAREILDTNRDARLSILHLSQQTLRPRPWIEIERMCSPSSPQEAVFSQEQAQQSSHAQVFPEPQREQAPKTVQIGRVETPPPPPPPASLSPQKRRKVRPSEASYLIECPHCKSDSQIKGDVLASKRSVVCSFCHSNISLRDGRVKLELDPSEVVKYRRVTNIFSYEGRIGVGGIWLGSFYLVPLLIIASLIAVVTHPIFYTLAAPLLYHPLWIKRLKDLGLHPSWILILIPNNFMWSIFVSKLPSIMFDGARYPVFELCLVLVSLVAIPLGIVMFLVPGRKRINRFGPPVSQMDIKD